MNRSRPEVLRQLTLPLTRREIRNLDAFVAGPNAEVLAALRGLPEQRHGRLVFLWGEHATGKTHLLHGTCGEFVSYGLSAAYVPLLEAVRAYEPDIFIQEGRTSLLCLDDVHAICGERVWETAMFNAFNAMLEAGATLVVAADRAPAALRLALEDLKSRLTSGLTFRLRPLDDPAKRDVLRLRAAARGLELPDAVADYLLHSLPRDLGRLLEVLDRLDAASLAAQRRLTLPFVKMLLEQGN